MRIRKQFMGAAGVLAMTAGLLGVSAAAAPSANAAGACTTSNTFKNAMGYTLYVPTGYPGGIGTSCVLSRGSSGSAVRALQWTLKKCYDSTIVVDGVFGAHTESVLKRAQSYYGAAPDGVYGPETYRKILFWFYKWENGTQRNACWKSSTGF
ncbi:peptidoglycan-binding domain-containing protein [Streptomyces fenghuangensis]|uniref:peptidoglycan-binding domain-containing protein n=1 Tax=Streptomyces sp. ICN903 TaxID=2964654 RepID=UPI001EDC319D|nr:peptidoglycan-binding domain-containing protein [Streptomyces sp. ICN903]MCG3040535.1 peptidoglycan-binding protein [Streptomyces sp. ICN903]